MSDQVYYRYYSSPIGRILLTSDGTALTGLYMAEPADSSAPEPGAEWKRDDSKFVAVCGQLDAYLSGELTDFDLPLRPKGTTFQRRVWQELCKIPYGRTISYLELARRIGQPTASRAVGGANGRNPISIIVPCHRVIASGGGLGGYGGGLDRKRWLLEHEAENLARHPRRTSTPSESTRKPGLVLA